MMGSAVAYDLAHSPGVEKVILTDIDDDRAHSAARAIGRNVEALRLDASNENEVAGLAESVDVVVGATSYTHNLKLTRAAIRAGAHFCDLGGNMDVVASQLALDGDAKKAGLAIIPNCGLAPGLACILGAGGAARFDSVTSIHLRVGGLPLHPKPPLNYQLVFSAEGLINEYIEPAEAVRNGHVVRVDSMADLEDIEFPKPFGMLEAFNTSGGVSTLPAMFQGRVKQLDYKTIRYKGHCEKFRTLLDLGFAGSEPLQAGSTLRTTRELFEELLRRKLASDGPDCVLMRVTVTGTIGSAPKTLIYQMIDRFDETTRITSMMRTTAFPASIIAQMIVNGTIAERGVMPPEQCVPAEPLIRELGKRNIIITQEMA
jgi:lysine 6-dehydrogenase